MKRLQLKKKSACLTRTFSLTLESRRAVHRDRDGTAWVAEHGGKYAKHKGGFELGKGADEEGTALLRSVGFAVLARILEVVSSRQFSILLKLRWAVLAIIKACRF